MEGDIYLTLDPKTLKNTAFNIAIASLGGAILGAYGGHQFGVAMEGSIIGAVAGGTGYVFLFGPGIGTVVVQAVDQVAEGVVDTGETVYQGLKTIPQELGHIIGQSHGYEEPIYFVAAIQSGIQYYYKIPFWDAVAGFKNAMGGDSLHIIYKAGVPENQRWQIWQKDYNKMIVWLNTTRKYAGSF